MPSNKTQCTPKNIRDLIDSQGWTLSSIARALDVSPSSLGRCIDCKMTSKKIATGLAKLLDVPVQDLFPSKPTYWSEHRSAAVINRLQMDAAIKAKLSA